MLQLRRLSRNLLTALNETCFKPVEFFGQVDLDASDIHVDDPVAALLQPRLPPGAVFCDDLRLIGIDQFDRYAVHERDEVRNVPADRRLAFELSGEPAVGGQRLPQDAFRGPAPCALRRSP